MHGTRSADLSEPMAQLYARDPSLWGILTNVIKNQARHGWENRFYAAAIAAITAPQNPTVRAVTHTAFLSAQHLLAGILHH